MKGRILASLVMACLPWLAMAQSNDDLYFVPKKEKKTEKKVEKAPVTKQNTTTVYAAPGSTVVVKDAAGNTRNVDEYNRRYTAKDNKFSVQNDTLYIEEKPYGERGEWVNGFEGSQDDYEYAMRIVRFRSPRYAIPVSSPLYWDVVYGAYPSWYWNVYDDGMYAYMFPTSSNPMWWDWRWSWGVSGPHWSIGFNWGPSWYSSWYSPSWYGGYWGGSYWAGYWSGYWNHYWGYWGPGWHHHYPYYGWAGSGWSRPGYTDYRPSRYTNYTSSRRNGVSDGRYIVPSGGSSSRRGTSIGRVVNPGNNNVSVSVRPSRPSTRPSGGSGNMGNVGVSSDRLNPSSGAVARPSRGNTSSYVRPSSTVDRTGSIYNRPSSTRRSSDYNRSNSRVGNTNSYTPRTSGSSFSRGSSSTRSSGGGGSVRSSSRGGGSSRR